MIARSPTTDLIHDIGPILHEAADAVRALDAIQPKLAGVDRLLRQNDASHALLRTSLLDTLLYEIGRKSPPERRIEEMAVSAAEGAEASLQHPFDRAMLERLHRCIHGHSWSMHVSRWAGIMRDRMDDPRPVGVPKDSIVDALQEMQDIAQEAGDDLEYVLVKACRIHWRIVRASPFENGNRVLAKVLLPALARVLSGHGYGSAYISESAAEDLDTYSDAMQAQNEISVVRTLLAMIARDARRNARRVEVLMGMSRQAQVSVRGYRHHALVHRLAPWTFIRPVTDIRKAQLAMRESNKALLTNYSRLQDHDVVVRHGLRPAIYLNMKALEVFGPDP